MTAPLTAFKTHEKAENLPFYMVNFLPFLSCIFIYCNLYLSSSSLLLFSLNPPIPAPSEETASPSHPSTPAGSPVLAAFVLLFDPVAVPDVFDPVVPVFVPDVPVVVVVLPNVEDAFYKGS